MGGEWRVFLRRCGGESGCVLPLAVGGVCLGVRRDRVAVLRFCD